MSGSQSLQNVAQSGAASPDGADPSMEDILASIRRILSEEDVPAVPPREEAEQQQDLFLLDSSRLVADPVPPSQRSKAARSAPPPPPPILMPPPATHDEERVPLADSVTKPVPLEVEEPMTAPESAGENQEPVNLP